MEKERPISKQEINLPILLEEARKGCKDIKDSVTRKVSIPLSDCLMSVIAMFGLKYPSLLQFDQDYRDEEALLQHNLKSLYGIQRVPSDTYFRERLDEVESCAPQGIINNVISILNDRKVFEKYKYLDDHYLVSLDATGNFSSHETYCDSCCVKNHKDGTTTYYHQTLAAVMVHPDHKEVFPLAIEPITKQDGNTKNDCEHNAAKRLLVNLRTMHPDMKIIVVMDGLYADGVIVELLKELNMKFIITAKEKDLDYLFDAYGVSKKQHSTTIVMKGHEQNFSFSEDHSLNYTHLDKKVNVLECEDIKKGKKTRFCWITDLSLTTSKRMTEKVARGGRARWKIENETFNTLKNQGYNFEHNYGHGKKNLCTVLTYLMFAAFLIDQAQEYCCKYFKELLEKCKSRTRLWRKLQDIVLNYFVDTWEQVHLMIMRGLRARAKDILDTG
jgi:hypothetical protein